MEVVHKNEAQEFKNSDTCSVFEYGMKEKEIDGAVIKLKGRYPESGFASNLKCKMICYLVRGNGKVFIEGRELFLSQGDLILIAPQEKYYWEGEMELFISSTPTWSKEQYRHIP